MLDASFQKLLNAGPALLRARWYLRNANRVGSKVRIWGNPSIRNEGELLVGDRVRIVSTMAKVELAIGEGGRLELGDNVFINYGCSVAATLSVRIASNSYIGSHVIMMDNDFHSVEPEKRDIMPPSAPIVIEEGAWLGVRVIVLRGVTIGAGSVIAAGSVVVRDIPARTIAAGMPAKVIRSL